MPLSDVKFVHFEIDYNQSADSGREGVWGEGGSKSG